MIFVGKSLLMQSLQISCQKIDLMRIQKSFDDIRRLQVPYCFDVIVNGRGIVSFIIQMVTILPEKKNKKSLHYKL